MEKWLKRVVELGAGLIFTGKEDPQVIDFRPSKTKLPQGRSTRLPRRSPRSAGISPDRLYRMISALAAEERVNIHNLIVIKDGYVVFEMSHPGYSVGLWHLSHSLSKSMVGTAIGMLVDEGRLTLDTALVDIFPELKFRDDAFRNITVKHLLTMTSGVRFAEVGLVSEEEWLRAFFDSTLAFMPGQRFGYNSMNSYVLGCVLHRLTGVGLTDYLRPRLLEPLGIGDFFWERGPEGMEKGGLGIFMTVEDWCKLGMLWMNGGVWRGRRLISQKWLEEATRVRISTPESTGDFDYGYHVWLGRNTDNFLFSGMFGQDVWMCPKNNITVGINAGNNELFQNSPGLRIIEEHLGGDLGGSSSALRLDGVGIRYFNRRDWIRPREPRRGILARLCPSVRDEAPAEWRELLGTYDFAPNNQGMLPLFIRLLQNNYGGGIKSITFAERAGEMEAVFTEGLVEYRLPIGFGEPRRRVLECRGERYIVATRAEVAEDEDRHRIFKLEILFPEMPNTRRIKMRFDGMGGLRVEFFEMPDQHALTAMLSDFSESSGRFAFISGVIERRFGKDFIDKRLADCFAPVLIGARQGSEEHDRVLEKASEGARIDLGTAALVNRIIDRFVSQEQERGVLDNIVGRLKARIPLLRPWGSSDGARRP